MSHTTIRHLLQEAGTEITFSVLMRRGLITDCCHKGSDGETLFAVRGGIGKFMRDAQVEGVVAALETLTAPPVKL